MLKSLPPDEILMGTIFKLICMYNAGVYIVLQSSGILRLYMESLNTGVNGDKSTSCCIMRKISNNGRDKKFTPQLNCWKV